jgi:hypothetical protein
MSETHAVDTWAAWLFHRCDGDDEEEHEDLEQLSPSAKSS